MSGVLGVVLLAAALGFLAGPALASEALRRPSSQGRDARGGLGGIAVFSCAASVLLALAAWWFARSTQEGGILSSYAEALSYVSAWDARSSVLFASAIPAFVAVLWFAGVSAALVVTDVRDRRLPNRLVLPSAVAVPCLLTISIVTAMLSGKPGWALDTWALPALIQTIGGALALLLLYLVLALVPGGGRSALGAGDVKLSPVVGAVLGFFGGWGAVIAGTLLAFLAAALVATWLLWARRGERGAEVPYGPCMLAGAWAALVLAEPIRAAWFTLTGAV